ncbi:MAG: ABC transporter transmembrane domain-containing protein [Ruthenibacterium lactatiformans]
MSKQKKEKQPPVLGRLLEYAGGHKWLSVLGCGLSGVSAAVGIFPFVFVWYAARGILTPGGGVPAGLARYGWYALAAALLSAAIYFAGLMCTHLAAFRVATNMRKAAAAHLIDLPLGYFNANLTGRLRKQIDDNAALTETLLAHTIPDAVGGIVTPILAVGLLFVFDWRMGLACLIPMIIGLVCLMTMMTGRGMKFFEEYQRAGERISAEATEYVRGIPVVKVFQQTVYSFKSFHTAILSYRDLASGYAMMCRMPYTLFTVVLNAMFLLLMPLGMVLVGGAADGWAVLADLVFYIFFAPQLAFMMERLMYAVNAQMEAAEAVNKLEAILRESPLPEPAADSGSKPADRGISFENVTFSYDGADRPALTNVSFHCRRGGVGVVALRRRQDHHRPADPALFRCAGRGGAPGGRDVRSIPTAS